MTATVGSYDSINQQSTSRGTGEDLIRDIREHDQKVAKLRRFFSDSWQAFEPWRDEALEAYRFVDNEQWSDSHIRQLRNRPHVVINEILATVLYLTGMQRQQRNEIKIFPFEGGDVRPAELMNGLVKHVELRSRGDQVDSWVFKDKVITGLGWWKMTLSFDETPEGELKWIRRNPLAIFADPNFLECGWNDAKFVFDAYFRDISTLIDEFPDKAEAIKQKHQDWLGSAGGGSSGRLWVRGDAEQAGDPFADKRTFWDRETQRARVLECWYANVVRVNVLLDQNGGEPKEIDDPTAARIASELAQSLTPNAMIVPRPVRKVMCAKLLDDVMLYEGPSPFDSPKFPIIPAVGHYFNGLPRGNVRFQMDPQRYHNKSRSAMIEMIAKMPHSGWQIDETTGPKKSEVVDYMNGNGVAIVHRGTPAQPINPPQLDQSVVFLERSTRDEISRVVNINTELLGQGTQRTVSGRAIEARQRSGMVVQEPMLDTFEAELREKTEFTVEIIPKFISVPQARRILGTIAVRAPDNPAAQVLSQMQGSATGEMELQQLLSGAFSTKFDVAVKTVPFEPSLQTQRWQILLELFQSIPPGTPLTLAMLPIMARSARDAGLLTKDDAQELLNALDQARTIQEQAGTLPQHQTPRPQGLFQGQPPPAGLAPLQ